MHRYAPPKLHDLLLPVIACLPTAFFSPQPPPALLPLLSPILRQRFSLHSQTAIVPGARANTREDNWLNLLTWSPKRAEQLREICSELQLEPHPVSGELELFEDEPESIDYRHLDAETVQAKCDVKKYGISVVWTWCTNDSRAVGVEALTGTNGGVQITEDGWRVAEVRPVAGTEDETWYLSQAEADEAASVTSNVFAPAQPSAPQPALYADTPASEDDYWASYDRTPSSRTPAHSSPGLTSAAPLNLNPLTSLNRRDSETEYFARYGAEVQPALDAHDPDETAAADATGENFTSTLGPSQPIPNPRTRSLHGQPTPPYDSDTGRQSQSKLESSTSNINGKASEGESYPIPYPKIPSATALVSPPTLPPSSDVDNTQYQSYLVAVDLPESQQDDIEATRIAVSAVLSAHNLRSECILSCPGHRNQGLTIELPVQDAQKLIDELVDIEYVLAVDPSTCTLHLLSSALPTSSTESNAAPPTLYQHYQDQCDQTQQSRPKQVHSPQPSRSNSPVNKLEHEARATSAAEVGVKQHISTEMKSLYRLARAAGIEREEFERVVRREIEVLGMMD